MTQLKTLKDIGATRKNGYVFVEYDELRQEAIKWAKQFKQEGERLFIEENNIYKAIATDMSAETLMQFFNLTNEDLR